MSEGAPALHSALNIRYCPPLPQNDAGDPWFIKALPFRNADKEEQPHPGLRSYPFLCQVCTQWKSMLSTSIAEVGTCCSPRASANPPPPLTALLPPFPQSLLWKNLVVDFGHELVTAIHTPLVWSNQRPTADEFQVAFSNTNLSAAKVNNRPPPPSLLSSASIHAGPCLPPLPRTACAAPG